MQRSREQILEWEARWRTPVAAATILGVVLLVASLVVVSGVGGEGSAEFLREADRDSPTIVLSGVLQTLGFLLIGTALVYLFRAAQGRSEKVRSQLIGLFVVAPIFLGLGAGLNSLATTEGADKFVAGEASADLTRGDASEECRDERDDDKEAFADDYPGGGNPLAECVATKLEDDEADDAIAGASLKGLAFGLQLAGMLGLAFSLMYGCLNAMRAGLLTRFWGSLGMALGVAAIFALPLTWLWFLYFGFLLLGAVPGGRPPAWDAGEAVPWPSPGERAAAEIEATSGGGDAAGEDAEPRDPGEPRRKRKRRE